ncbi:hypothetical protein T310_5327 [Rasamsonia emersonii CBS 393.64]|uniref:Uncharacterized protein n=1 Tax=Rasamsonia emersonii (strain ATCC 16479 / CBS 393.64 / IMI 116815) TaxID=1408163 RepID=A0A0F4YRE2_RASE3|nr:hypothetical protein T310_5327 [Rasamsonia emersonii CBS 393.64]KKA20650.1 hypothetical protein T310_5327 [Rasamsonia emersonii CBS 393.64]
MIVQELEPVTNRSSVVTPNSEDKTLAAPDKRCPWLRASIDLPGQDSRLASRRSSVTGCRRPSVSKAEDGRGCGGCWPSIASTVPARGQPQYDGHSMNWHGRWSSCALGQGLLGESTIVFLLRVSSRHFLFSEIQGPCGSKGTIADSGYVPCSRSAAEELIIVTELRQGGSSPAMPEHSPLAAHHAIHDTLAWADSHQLLLQALQGRTLCINGN